MQNVSELWFIIQFNTLFGLIGIYVELVHSIFEGVNVCKQFSFASLEIFFWKQGEINIIKLSLTQSDELILQDFFAFDFEKLLI